MIAVILSVLKIIGIVLLSLLGFLILLILMVLFVPIRYKIKAFKNRDDSNNWGVTANFSFLLHILNGCFIYPADDKFFLRLLWFKIVPGREKRSKKTNKKNKSSKQSSVQATNVYETDDSLTDEDEPTIEELEQAALEKKYDSDAESIRRNAYFINEELTEDNPTIRKFIDKIIDFLKHFKRKVLAFINKIKDMFENIEYYLDLFGTDLFKDSFALCKKECGKLFKAIRPRKIKGTVCFGNGDPQTAGKVFGVYSIVYPYIGNKINFIPYFEDEIFTVDLFMKGRITLFTVLVIAIKIYFNKDIKKTLRLLKREK